jgi:hypothetical protein
MATAVNPGKKREIRDEICCVSPSFSEGINVELVTKWMCGKRDFD